LIAFAHESVAAMTPDQHAIYDVLHDEIFGQQSQNMLHLHFLTGKAG